MVSEDEEDLDDRLRANDDDDIVIEDDDEDDEDDVKITKGMRGNSVDRFRRDTSDSELAPSGLKGRGSRAPSESSLDTRKRKRRKRVRLISSAEEEARNAGEIRRSPSTDDEMSEAEATETDGVVGPAAMDATFDTPSASPPGRRIIDDDDDDDDDDDNNNGNANDNRNRAEDTDSESEARITPSGVSGTSEVPEYQKNSGNLPVFRSMPLDAEDPEATADEEAEDGEIRDSDSMEPEGRALSTRDFGEVEEDEAGAIAENELPGNRSVDHAKIGRHSSTATYDAKHRSGPVGSHGSNAGPIGGIAAAEVGTESEDDDEEEGEIIESS